MRLFLVSQLLLVFVSLLTLTQGIFYPFDSSSGDSINPAIDDGSSSVIPLLSPFLFFGRTYQQIYVNNNGHLTFNEPSDQYIPYSFNGSQDIIAGLWTDLDNSVGGVISYHQYTNGSVLTRATQDINNHFPNLAFSASWVFVATWDKVAYYPNSITETSFQVVLISGSSFSFILMNYGDINVTVRAVEAGYDTVNSTDYFVIPGSINGSFISNLKNSSNVNVPGRWAFRVDSGHNTSESKEVYLYLGEDDPYQLNRLWVKRPLPWRNFVSENPGSCWFIPDFLIMRLSRVSQLLLVFISVLALTRAQTTTAPTTSPFVTTSKLVTTSPIVTSATTTSASTLADPCYNYTTLNDSWRATNNLFSSQLMCDTWVSWNGWYRLFVQGQSVQMPDTCVDAYSCGTFIPLWLDGGHPTVEDGVVTRAVCGNWSSNCCWFRSNPIKVKACPGNYYVYEFVSPVTCHLAYCAEVRNITTSNATVTLNTTLADPCYNYTTLNDSWRATNNLFSSQQMCDAWVSWNGWYRLFVQGQSVQMSDTCVDEYSCGTNAPLWLNGGHPKVEDGVVTRAVCGHWKNDCCYFQSNPIKVKACPGNYYVYEFVSPVTCHSAYCAEVRNIIINYPTVTPNTTLADPCFSYTDLNDSWRATNNHQPAWCDTSVNWHGWYRLFIQGQSAQMPDTCVATQSCGTYAPLWLKGGHPQIEDGVVTRAVCGNWWNDCCLFRSNPIKVKACPGNYYVYEFVSPIACYLAYCAEVRNITTNNATVTLNTAPGIFYPFGSSSGGDTINPAIDDGSSSVIPLLSPFLFFGRTYQQIYVNNNGHLTFNEPSDQYIPYSFNGSQDIIAGLWTDLDNHVRGVISYHQYTNGSVLTRATQDINNHFPNLAFSASWVFVATWDKVAYYPTSITETSFQVVLISGSSFSFILMNYGDINVTGHPVKAGYDSVNSIDYFVIPGSINGSFISNLKNSSNVNVPGRWAFRVDTSNNNVIGLQVKFSSFSDLTQSGNIEIVLQQIKQALVNNGLPSNIELKLRKVQKIKP